jgi:hypothetical protein
MKRKANHVPFTKPMDSRLSLNPYRNINLWEICGERTGVMNTKTPSYRGFRFPSEVISHAVWLYHRFVGVVAQLTYGQKPHPVFRDLNNLSFSIGMNL